MDKKVRIDLSSPPPVPTEEPPKVPADQAAVEEAPKPQVQHPEENKEKTGKKPEKKSRKRGVVLGVLAGVAAAAALLGGYRFIHFWSDPTCDQKSRCSICGLEQGGYAAHTWEHVSCDTPMVCTVCGAKQEGNDGHEWTGGSCTEPGTCIHCGQTEPQARGHSYQDGICTVCGAEQTNGIVLWEENEGHDVEAEWLEEDHALVLSDASLQNFAQMAITIRDCWGKAVSTDSYTVERSEDSVRLNLPRNLAPGRYVIHAGVQETTVMQFWFGTGGSWMPDEADQWYSNFVISSWKHGQYLAQVPEDVPLRGVPAEAEATRFDSPWQMCGGVYNEDGRIVLFQTGTQLKFVVDRYRRFDETGSYETACVFRFENWYLTMNGEGEVSMTDILDEGCFWLVTSSLE